MGARRQGAAAGDFEQFEPLLEGTIRRIPFLDRAEIVTLVRHPGAYTPDSRPLLGPLPGVRGFWCAAGLSLNGYGGAGGMGKLLAEWIVEGEPSLDVFGFHAWRFGRYYANPDYAAERTREGVKYYYLLRYPNDENEWARPHRVSPVHNRLQELGAVFGEKNGWERVNYFQPGKAWRRMGADQREWGWTRPPYFERVGQEHAACRERVAIFDMTSFGKIDLRGPGALPLLQRLADNQMDVPVGRAVYTQFLNTKGNVEADVTITRLGPKSFRLVTGSNFIGNDLGLVRMGLRPGDPPVEIRDVTEELATIGLWGPKARQVLQAVTTSDVSNQAIPYMSSATIDIQGVAVLAQRVTLRRRAGLGVLRPDRERHARLGRAVRRRPEVRHRAGRLQGARLAATGEGLPLLQHGRDHDREPLHGRARASASGSTRATSSGARRWSRSRSRASPRSSARCWWAAPTT